MFDTLKIPDRASLRSKRDATLKEVMAKLWKNDHSVCGHKKLWRALRREVYDAACCTVVRLMREMGIRGVIRGKKVVTTNPDAAQPCPDDRGHRTSEAGGDIPDEDMPHRVRLRRQVAQGRGGDGRYEGVCWK